MTKAICTVDTIKPLTSGVNQVVLTPEQQVGFKPGQYLQLCLTDQDKRPFSIASIPGQAQSDPQTPPPATSGAAKGKGKAAGKKSNTAPQQPPSQPDPGHDFDDEIPF